MSVVRVEWTGIRFWGYAWARMSGASWAADVRKLRDMV